MTLREPRRVFVTRQEAERVAKGLRDGVVPAAWLE